jgi:nicotinamidase-related amidase
MLLDELRVDTLILTGIAGNICILSANRAYMHKYHLIIPSDCIASHVKEENEFALRMMKNGLQPETLAHTYYIN